MKRRSPQLVWDDWNNRDHIKKHLVTEDEIEEAYANEFARSDSYKKREAIFGSTLSGKLITIAVSYAKQIDPYVVSARVMSAGERKKYVHKAKTN
ncbi:hypothetical protein HY409_04055 [Candidatus Gottesmanbacteria bacterium]|nr:hypothetical protein [Candidatus Gottesmanbacteria bacterium]